MAIDLTALLMHGSIFAAFLGEARRRDGLYNFCQSHVRVQLRRYFEAWSRTESQPLYLGVVPREGTLWTEFLTQHFMPKDRKLLLVAYTRDPTGKISLVPSISHIMLAVYQTYQGLSR